MIQFTSLVISINCRHSSLNKKTNDMKFSDFETIILLKDYPKYGLKKGDKGAIIMSYEIPAEAYEVEFVDSDGKTVAQLILYPNEIAKPEEIEI